MNYFKLLKPKLIIKKNKMKIPILFLLSLFNISIQSEERGEIYRCNDGSYIDEQCLTHERIGKININWIKKCKGSKVCIKLPYYGGMAGVCSIKVRPHYDGESCQKNNKCTSGICENSKCKGFSDNQNCQPGLGQCKKGKACRKENNENKTDYHYCLDPIKEHDDCDGLIKENIEKDGLLESNYSKYFFPENNICELGSVCSNSKCVKIGSINENSEATNPLACASGTFVYNSTKNIGKCLTFPQNNNTCYLNKTKYVCNINNIEIDCLKTSKGAHWCPTYAITTAFNEWLAEWTKRRKEQEDTVLEAYRYTANKKSVNELFFRYKLFGLITDADECAYDYFWKNNFSQKLSVSMFIFILGLLF